MAELGEQVFQESSGIVWCRPLLERLVSPESELDLKLRQAVADLFNEHMDPNHQLVAQPPEGVDLPL
jgi:hypothetical protein